MMTSVEEEEVHTRVAEARDSILDPEVRKTRMGKDLAA
jgi:hypothetical protein